MKKWIHDKATVVFWLTLIVYILIWLTVSYVGVYVTYVAAPVLVVSGTIALLTAANEET